MNGNCILRVARHSSEMNGEYCGINDVCAHSILLPCPKLQDIQNYAR